ncbi:L-fucokinase/GDP-L-fucose pyrophosphorylase [Trifolium repens]|nr:L-fucokinase/GDP-L-fucose pyrophosphorylase [Trifolium repens]
MEQGGSSKQQAINQRGRRQGVLLCQQQLLLLYFGVILDPRFKKRIIGWKFKEMYVGRAQFGADLLESIEASLTKLYNWYKQEYDKNSTQSNPMIVDPVVDTTMPADRYSREKSAMSFDAHLKEERMVNSKNELQAYLTSPCEPKSATCKSIFFELEMMKKTACELEHNVWDVEADETASAVRYGFKGDYGEMEGLVMWGFPITNTPCNKKNPWSCCFKKKL